MINFFNAARINIIHATHEGHSWLADFFKEHLGVFGTFLEEVLIHGIIDTLVLIPFLFLTYLLMEFIEHKAGDKTLLFMKKSGSYGPLAGGVIGIVPQCGFSSVASNLYCGKVITTGTLIAVFLSTSDEMLPILIGNSDIKFKTILFILLYKVAVAIAVGFAVDLVFHLLKKDNETINIDELCDNDNCHCEKGIFHSALHHTVSITLFILLCTIFINIAVFLIGEENLVAIMYNKPVLSHIIASLFGLIPNCAVSVALTEFYTSGFITLGTMLAGLFSGAGVGLLVLFKVNRDIKRNLVIVGILLTAGALFGLLADIIGFEAIIT